MPSARNFNEIKMNKYKKCVRNKKKKILSARITQRIQIYFNYVDASKISINYNTYIVTFIESYTGNNFMEKSFFLLNYNTIYSKLKIETIICKKNVNYHFLFFTKNLANDEVTVYQTFSICKKSKI
ncbi:hypothetical protein EDEG_01642 [Edhazardia aedis USNM 41457]|uniref:Uncharacterized protein n=1 Tax=Edhazardia aedis (strain USNM 41457) TaxID=1003232 RepID=J9D8J7_EDHAE|nr:hypothetical protein EDEG_01642 [Edhazardia aedis USNM 41457]|eukprot:EJW04066.1 hypothetical protein EDEG_01642 [Edhazardia aedis USNM 41457]